MCIRDRVNAKCEELQQNLVEKHESEIKEWKIQNGEIDDEEEEEITPEKLLAQLEIKNEEPQPEVESKQEETHQEPKKRRNRQKERLAKRDAEIAKIKEEAKLEAAKQPNLKKIEQDALNQLYQINKVKEFDIKPDGHCLFASILDQLKLRHNDVDPDLNVSKLRTLSCNYIRANKDDFIPVSYTHLDVYKRQML